MVRSASAALDELRVLNWLTLHRRPDEQVAIENMSDALGCFALAGPKSRQVLRTLTAQDLSNAGFPWMTSRVIDVAGISVRALRLSLTGELGWEPHGRMADNAFNKQSGRLSSARLF